MEAETGVVVHVLSVYDVERYELCEAHYERVLCVGESR